MQVHRYNLGPLDNNTYVVEDSGEAVVIDPTFLSDSLVTVLRERGLNVTAVLNTHAHIDHVVENALFMEQFHAPLALHEADLPVLRRLDTQAEWMGIPPPRPSEPTIWLQDGGEVRIGAAALRVIHTPGHSPGHVAFAGEGFCIVGDVLFQDSIGRTDLPGGSLPQLLDSIRDRLLPLPDDTIVYPGHGPITTMGRERGHNPFLQELAPRRTAAGS